MLCTVASATATYRAMLQALSCLCLSAERVTRSAVPDSTAPGCEVSNKSTIPKRNQGTPSDFIRHSLDTQSCNQTAQCKRRANKEYSGSKEVAFV